MAAKLGTKFRKSGRTISEEYNVPLLMKFELHGKTKTLLNLRTRWVILMKTMEEKKYNHIELNNEVTKRRDGFFSLEKTKKL